MSPGEREPVSDVRRASDASAPALAAVRRAAAALRRAADAPRHAANARARFRAAATLLLDESETLRSTDAQRLWCELLSAWLKDEDGALGGVAADRWLADVAAPRGGAAFRRAAATLRDELPLVFARDDADPLDPHRLALAARRGRLDRLLGEALAAAGAPAFAVEAGLEKWRREADAADAVFALYRAGRPFEALALAREALATPTAVGADVLRLLVDRLFPDRGVRRREVRATEREFFERPSRAGYEALMNATPPDQRAAVAARVLGALQRTRREPGLVFELYLDEDRLLDADGMATTQRIPAETLVAAADRILATRPTVAAGWLLIAAHRLADAAEPARRAAAPALLVRVRELAAETGRTEDFRRALAGIRSRHADRPAFLRALRRAGL